MNIKILDKTTCAVAHEDVDSGIGAFHRFIEGYCWLAVACHLEGRKLFKLRPKRLGSTIILLKGRFRLKNSCLRKSNHLDCIPGFTYGSGRRNAA